MRGRDSAGAANAGAGRRVHPGLGWSRDQSAGAAARTGLYPLAGVAIGYTLMTIKQGSPPCAGRQVDLVETGNQAARSTPHARRAQVPGFSNEQCTIGVRANVTVCLAAIWRRMAKRIVIAPGSRRLSRLRDNTQVTGAIPLIWHFLVRAPESARPAHEYYPSSLGSPPRAGRTGHDGHSRSADVRFTPGRGEGGVVSLGVV